MHHRFISNMANGWQDKSWIKYSDTCPYNMFDRNKEHQPEFMKEAWFRYYCTGTKAKLPRGSNNPPQRGGSTHRHGKLYKLYWSKNERPNFNTPVLEQSGSDNTLPGIHSDTVSINN